MTRAEVEQAVMAGVRPTLSEWHAISGDCREMWADETAKLERSRLLTVVTAAIGEQEARAVARALQGRQARVEAALRAATQGSAGWEI